MQAIKFGANVPGYVCGAVGKPGVIVVQEWWGVTKTVKAQAERIAAGGYRCLVPDLYKGKLAEDKEEAAHLMTSLDFQAAVGELGEAAQFLRAEGSPKVGVVGFCMGGALSLAAAQHAAVDCAAPFYGTPQAGAATPEGIAAAGVPCLVSVGALDQNKGFSDPATMRVYAEKINAAGGTAEFVEYPDCGHGFLNSGDEAAELRARMGFPAPPPEQQENAWARLLAFFKQHLN